MYIFQQQQKSLSLFFLIYRVWCWFNTNSCSPFNLHNIYKRTRLRIRLQSVPTSILKFINTTDKVRSPLNKWWGLIPNPTPVVSSVCCPCRSRNSISECSPGSSPHNSTTHGLSCCTWSVSDGCESSVMVQTRHLRENDSVSSGCTHFFCFLQYRGGSAGSSFKGCFLFCVLISYWFKM